MFRKIIPLLVFVFIITSCTTKTGPADAYVGETPHQIFAAGEADMHKGDYSSAIKRFEALDVQYPLDRETELAEVHLIYAYYRKEDYALSEAAANRFIRAHPMSAYTDYAYFMQGLSDFYENQGVLDRLFSVDFAKRDNTPLKKAYFDFETIVTRFPNSKYAKPAYQYMVYLRNTIARHQLQVAQFYFDRRAYVAAINRANNVVKHYEGSPSVMPALQLIKKSYHALGLTEKEREIDGIIQLNK